MTRNSKSSEASLSASFKAHPLITESEMLPLPKAGVDPLLPNGLNKKDEDTFDLT
jgi:hypothetical protein